MFPLSKSRFTIIILLIFTLFLQSSYGFTPLFHFCSTTENFTINDGPYQINLNKLLSNLYLKAPPTNFALGTIGSTARDKAYGLVLCRGDASKGVCKTCAGEAIEEIRQRCPYSKESIIWYDNCLLKYANDYFFGQIDNQYKFYMWNVRSVNETAEFNNNTKVLLSKLAIEASSSAKLYAAGELEIGGELKKLYGLAQCTRDLSSNVCRMCLDGIIGELPYCCNGKEGGRVISGSCNFRYEIYPFVVDSA